MTDRRYSIIPARAVADPRLEGRDLQVLCFLGMHTDKLGWCFLGQGMIAEKVGCGRSTVQRSIARLIEAGFVATREFNGARPHACHAYRVVMDLDDPQLEPPADVVGDDDDGSRCPQAGTSPGGASPAGTGAQPRTGTSAPEVPTHAWAHNDQDSGGDGGGCARARPSIRPEAWTLAEEIGAIAGYPTKQDWPPGWCGSPIRVEAWLVAGWQRETALSTARAVMANKRDGPPDSIKYFEKAIARAIAQQSTPLPVVTIDQRPSEVTHAQTPRHASDWKGRRDRGHSALDRFGKALADAEDDQRGQASEVAVRIDVAAGRG